MNWEKIKKDCPKALKVLIESTKFFNEDRIYKLKILHFPDNHLMFSVYPANLPVIIMEGLRITCVKIPVDWTTIIIFAETAI